MKPQRNASGSKRCAAVWRQCRPPCRRPRPVASDAPPPATEAVVPGTPRRFHPPERCRHRRRRRPRRWDRCRRRAWHPIQDETAPADAPGQTDQPAARNRLDRLRRPAPPAGPEWWRDRTPATQSASPAPRRPRTEPAHHAMSGTGPARLCRIDRREIEDQRTAIVGIAPEDRLCLRAAPPPAGRTGWSDRSDPASGSSATPEGCAACTGLGAGRIWAAPISEPVVWHPARPRPVRPRRRMAKGRAIWLRTAQLTGFALPGSG